MLFERWDASRGINTAGTLKADTKNALQHVALWIYSTEGLASGVKQKRLAEEVSGRG